MDMFMQAAIEEAKKGIQEGAFRSDGTDKRREYYWKEPQQAHARERPHSAC